MARIARAVPAGTDLHFEVCPSHDEAGACICPKDETGALVAEHPAYRFHRECPDPQRSPQEWARDCAGEALRRAVEEQERESLGLDSLVGLTLT